MLLFFFCAACVGAAIPIQTAANTTLRSRLHSPYLASMINGTVGTLILTAALIVWPHSLEFSLSDLEAQPLWLWGGGIGAVIILLLAIVAMEHLGAMGTALCLLSGSVAGGILFDCTGMFRVPVHPMTLLRASGLLLALIGFALVLRLPQKLRQHQKALSLEQIPFVLAGFIAGLTQVSQTAMNSELTLHLGSSIAAGWTTMAQSAVFLLVIALLKKDKLSKLTTMHMGKSSWILCGGLCGAAFLIVNSLLLKSVGAGPLVILNISGQLTAALLIDRFGLFGSQKKSVSKSQIAGLIIVFAAVALIKNPF